MAGSILGNRVLRKEDPKFLTSGGKYVEDLLDEPLLANAAYVTYVRSSVAHGKIVGIDTSAAAAMPGVLGIYTAADLGLTEEPATFNPAATRGRLAIGKVRFVGEPVAAVVTETRQQGADAAEQVVVDYEVLEALVDPEEAMKSSTLIFEGAGSNVVFDTTALGMPVIQTIAFSGTFFAITKIPGFPTDRSVNWYLPLACCMGSGFAGVGLGFSTVRDIESGFFDRLRMAPSPRSSLVVGPLFTAWFRVVIVITTTVLVGFLWGARLTDGPIGLVTLYIAGFGIATISTGWGLGLAYVFGDMDTRIAGVL